MQSSNKPSIFISHISEEKDLAIMIKEMLENKYVGFVDVFVSSDDESIPAGAKWLDNVIESLKTCAIAIILTSDKSVKRPWINFEAGACWVREIPVIPICHSGLEQYDMPLPFKMLQGIKISEPTGLRSLFATISRTIGGRVPSLDGIDDFINRVKQFEDSYTYWDMCNKKFDELISCVPDIIRRLDDGDSSYIALVAKKAEKVNELITEYFEPSELVTTHKGGASLMGDMQWYYEYGFSALDGYRRIKKHPSFRYR